MTKIQVTGLCRYSYPSQVGSFTNKGQDLDELRAELYNDTRLSIRHFFFENIVVPSVRSQTDKDFTLILMLGDTFPEPWRSKLLAVIADVPQIKPVFLPEGQGHVNACQEVMLDHRDLSADVVAEFRLDDDDAMSGSFVAELRSLYSQIKPLYKQTKRFCVDYSRGFLFRCFDDGTVGYQPCEARLWALAMALYYPPSHKRSVLNYPHMRTWRAMPVLMLNHKPMYIRGAHENNDSGIRERNADAYRYDLEKLPDLMQRDFGIDLEVFEANWATASAVLRND